jgi:prepilin-type N-terminal cleavage/methylation domain-containing protein
MYTMLRRRSGVTLIETVIAIAILAVVAFSLYQAFAAIFDILNVSEVRIAAAALANEQIELIRNMGYESIGTIGGVPNGFVEPFVTRNKNGMIFDVNVVIRNVDDPFDGTIGGSPNDLSPADYKLIELTIQCTTCEDTTAFLFTGRAAPRSLETASTNGSLFVQVIDASGLPVSGATVQITNPSLTPAISITDTTDVTGFLKIIDVPPAAQSYHIVVSKAGYSSEQTYAVSVQNPNPLKPDATVVLQTVTQTSFSIDRVSQLNVASVGETCAPIPTVNFSLAGAKLIGTSPDVQKFAQNYTTDGGGLRSIANLEWDNYTFTIPAGAYALRGTIPLSPLSLAPDKTQDFKIVMTPQNPLSLLVTVEDAATQLPITNASVSLTAPGFSSSLTTGRGSLRQTDWSGGSGQAIFTVANQYADDDGNIDVATSSGNILLKEVTSGVYATAGFLTSSVFDTGSPSNFFELMFDPQSQPPATGPNSARIQFATATTTDPLAWNYVGPDGTSATYYTGGNTTINALHNGDQYFRYRVYLSTALDSVTPSVSDVAVTFGSNCVPPGQVLFSGLSPDTYSVSVQHPGYQAYNDVVTVISPWQESVIQLSP